MAESFENIKDILPDRVNDNVEKCLAEAVDKYEKQEEEIKPLFVKNEFPEFFPINKVFCLHFVSLLYKTNRFHVAARLFSNRSQKTSKCRKNISDTLA